MRDKIRRALAQSQADYTEIRLEERHATSIAFRGKELETANAVIDAGGIVRCLCREGGWGIATFNDREDLPDKVSQATACARIAQSETAIELADVPACQDEVRVSLLDDFRSISMADKKSLAERYNRVMLSYDGRIVDTRCSYSDSFSRVVYANSAGTYIEQERPMVTAFMTCTAREGDNVQRAHESRSGQRGFEYVQDLEELALTAARRACELLGAETVVGGNYPVLVDPQLAGVFIHEAFGHLSESDFVYENPKAQEMMVLGRRFGPETLTVFDDGSAPGLRGTHPYDDEGTPTGRTDLIRNGLLVGRLHSRETAAKLGEQPTGNARATRYRYPPIVRMTNTAIEAGETSLAEMLAGIDLGVYACGSYGGQTALESFSFSSAYGYMIRDGQIAEMVKDVILAGNLFETLKNIDAVGSDFRWSESGGACGKGQGGLPVTFGAPHIRIQNVTIGGR